MLERDKHRVHLADFGTGILAGLAAEGIKSIHVTHLDAALVKAFEFLETQDCDLRFHISLHEIHGDAPEARRAIGGAVSRGLGNFDNDRTLYLSISKDAAPLYFKGLPLDENIWRQAAREVLSLYNW